MKKTLLLAAALACSGVAQAAVYSCTIEAEINMSSPEGATSEWPAGRMFFVDTEKGYRVEAANFWSGSCSVGKKITCSVSTLLGVDYGDTLTVVIDTEFNLFTAAHLFGLSSNSSTGPCDYFSD